MRKDILTKGFTLIELMVVVTIIAILVIIGIAIYGGAQKNSRDALRKADMDTISKALEAHYNPLAATCVNDDSSTEQVAGSSYCKPQGSWFTDKKIPQDPKNSGEFVYTGIPQTSGATSFVICARLENNGGNASDITGTSATGNNATHYCRKAQQQ